MTQVTVRVYGPLNDFLPGLQIDADTLVFAIADDSSGTNAAENALIASLSGVAGKALAAALGVESKNAKAPDETKRRAARSELRAKLLADFAKTQSKAVAKGLKFRPVSDTARVTLEWFNSLPADVQQRVCPQLAPPPPQDAPGSTPPSGEPPKAWLEREKEILAAWKQKKK